MNIKQRINLLIILSICINLGLKAQTKDYKFERSISGITTNWHSIQLPNQVFKNAQIGLEDLRIFGKKGKDTIEVPYILEQSADQITEKETPFKIINQSSVKQGHYYTFEADQSTIINQIRLSFKESNFDWNVDLEGSNNNLTWFQILKDARILSIKNNSTDYQFTQLDFPMSRYKYFRILIKGPGNPELNAAKILKTDTIRGNTSNISFKSYALVNNSKTKETVIDVELSEPSPISFIKLNFKNALDFYRPMKVEYAIDSFKTEKGIQHQFNDLVNVTLSSLEKPEFTFKGTLVSRLRITIQNDDNARLSST